MTGAPEYLTYDVTEEEMANEDLSNLRHIRSGERALEIEIHKPIPSYVKISGKRARVWYPGQNYNCGRCYKSFRSCPGKADRAECKRKKGVERDFEDFWQEVLSTGMRREKMDDGDTYNTDTIDVGNCPKDITRENILEILASENIDFNPENLVPTTFPETWRMLNVSAEMVPEIVERMHGKKFKNRNLLFLPIQIKTPTKGSKGTEVEINPQARAEEAAREREEEERKRKEREDEIERLRKEDEKRKEDEARLARLAAAGGGVTAGRQTDGGEDSGPAGGQGGVETTVSENTVQSSIFGNLISNVQKRFGVVRDKTNVNANKPPPPSNAREDEDFLKKKAGVVATTNEDEEMSVSPVLKLKKTAAPEPDPDPQPLPPLPEPVPIFPNGPPPPPAGQAGASAPPPGASAPPPGASAPPPGVAAHPPGTPGSDSLTIDSQDEIFGTPRRRKSIKDLLAPKVYTSEFAREVSMSRLKETVVEDTGEPVNKKKRSRIQVGYGNDSSVSSSGDSPAAKQARQVPDTPEEKQPPEETEDERKSREEKEETDRKRREQEKRDDHIRKTFNIPVGFEMSKSQRKKYQKKLKNAEEKGQTVDVIESSLKKGEPTKSKKNTKQKTK